MTNRRSSTDVLRAYLDSIDDAAAHPPSNDLFRREFPAAHHGFPRRFPGLDDAWAIYYPAIDLLAVHTHPAVITGQPVPDSPFTVEALRAAGFDIDDVREVPVMAVPSKESAAATRAHELAHVQFSKLSWWWVKIALTNAHANMLFQNVHHRYSEGDDGLLTDLINLVAFEWNSQRLVAALRPLQEAMATMVAAVHASEATTTILESEIQKREHKLQLMSLSPERLAAAITGMPDPARRKRARTEFAPFLAAHTALNWRSYSFRETFHDLSYFDIQTQEREWQICLTKYEQRVLCVANRLIEVANATPTNGQPGDRMVMTFLATLATVAADDLRNPHPALVPPRDVPPSNRFLEVLDIVADHPSYYVQAIRPLGSTTPHDQPRQVFTHCVREAYRLFQMLGFPPTGIPLLTGPLMRLDGVGALMDNSEDNPYLTAVKQQVQFSLQEPTPLFLLLKTEEAIDVRLKLPDNVSLEEVEHTRLNYWMTILRWQFVESLETGENKIDPSLLEHHQPSNADTVLSDVRALVQAFQQTHRRTQLLGLSKEKLQTMDIPPYADPCVP